MKKIDIIIPSRYASTRLNGKPLILIDGKELILHVIERVKGANVSNIIVATDNHKIKMLVDETGFCEAIMTDKKHTCGTDRIAEIAKTLSSDYIINVQGDQLISGPDMIDDIIMHINNSMEISTLYTQIKNKTELIDKNVVKVVLDKHKYIIYMSRACIPCGKMFPQDIEYHKQVGIYVFRRQSLISFSEQKSDIEHIEGIELLRALYHGWSVKGIYTMFPTSDVNTSADLILAKDFVRKFPVDID